LGTSENFLICDRRFAVLGTDPSLTRHTVFPELELKLRTTDADAIQQLIHRFDHPDPHPTDVTAHWNRGVTRYELGDKLGAIADFSQVIDLAAEDAVAYNYRGLAQYDIGEQTRAIADFNRALSIDSESAVVYCNRGFVLAEMGEHLAAIADYSLAIQNQPSLAIAHFYRGQSYQTYGDPQGALVDYTEAIRLTPTAAPCYYYRGLIRQKLGDWYGAIADLEMASQQFNRAGNPTNAQKALKLLTQLKKLTTKSTNGSTSALQSATLRENLSSSQEQMDGSSKRNGTSHGMNNGAISTLAARRGSPLEGDRFVSLVNATSDPLPSLFNISAVDDPDD
jgi:tetratricopeptide (TPR) repeat protein